MTNARLKTDAHLPDTTLELRKLQAYYLAGGQCATCDRLLVFSSYNRQDLVEGWRIGRRLPDRQAGHAGGNRAGNWIAICLRCPAD